MSETVKLYWEMFKSLAGLVGAIASFVLLLIAIRDADHGNYAEATFFLALIIMVRVFDLGGKRP